MKPLFALRILRLSFLIYSRNCFMSFRLLGRKNVFVIFLINVGVRNFYSYTWTGPRFRAAS